MSNEGKTFLVQINYRSGHKIEAWFDEFDIKYDVNSGSVTSAEWKLSDTNQVMLFININAIESVMQLTYKNKLDSTDYSL